jgi:hypothetical protein
VILGIEPPLAFPVSGVAVGLTYPTHDLFLLESTERVPCSL